MAHAPHAGGFGCVMQQCTACHNTLLLCLLQVRTEGGGGGGGGADGDPSQQSPQGTSGMDVGRFTVRSDRLSTLSTEEERARNAEMTNFIGECTVIV